MNRDIAVGVSKAVYAPAPPRTTWVRDQIREAILSGEYPPGSSLVEADLAAKYGVSKTPVREALKTLAGRGLVRMGDFRGATVGSVDERMVSDVFGLRLLLEPAAVAQSVLEGISFSHARAALEAADAAQADAERSHHNREFHRLMYSGCGNSLMVEILDGLRDRTMLISIALWRSVASWDTEAGEHRDILSAAQTGDAQQAEDLVRQHIEHFAQRCAEKLQLSQEE